MSLKRNSVLLALSLLILSFLPAYATLSPFSGWRVARMQGFVNIGPTCPVEFLERPCPVPDYSTLSLVLTSVSEGTAVHIPLASDGSYEIAVPAGTYSITLQPCTELGCSTVFPQTITLEQGSLTTKNFDIDTGIRLDPSLNHDINSH